MSKHIKHLLITTPGFPKDEADTTFMPAVQQFILCFQRIYPETKISVVSLHYPYYQASYEWHNVSVYSIGGRAIPGFRRGFTILNSIAKGLLINKRRKVDAILSFWITDSAFGGKIISRLLNKPQLIWMHGQDAKPGNKYYKLSRSKAPNLAAISEFQDDVLFKSYGERANYIIHNGINGEAFPKINEGHREVDLYAAGYLIPLKQYHLFIELVKFLKENGHPNINAKLSGIGSLEDELKQKVKDLGLEKNLEFLGKTPHDEVLRWMNNSKLFIHTSNYEGHSTVMLEALYSGCKILSFIPVASTPVDNFYLCRDMDEMIESAQKLLGQKHNYSRVKVNEMSDSVQKVYSILKSI